MAKMEHHKSKSEHHSETHGPNGEKHETHTKTTTKSVTPAREAPPTELEAPLDEKEGHPHETRIQHTEMGHK